MRDRGPGVAFDVQVNVIPDSGGTVLGVVVASAVSRLDAGATARVNVPISAAIDARELHPRCSSR